MFYIFSDEIIILDHLLIALLSEGGNKLFCSCPELPLSLLFDGLELLCHEQSNIGQQNQVRIVFLPALGGLANEVLTELERLGLLLLLLEDVFETLQDRLSHHPVAPRKLVLGHLAKHLQH